MKVSQGTIVGWNIRIFIQKEHNQNLQVGPFKIDRPFR